MVSAALNHPNIASRLLKSSKNVNYASTNGTTALIAASRRGNDDIIKLLMDKQADIDYQDQVDTLFHCPL